MDEAKNPPATGNAIPSSPCKLIAFYLPQFHPIPENDLWWGKGFTEWTNVTKSQPLFDGHYQPHLPADLGYYDLRLRTVRHEQIALAKQYGIHGFCYHYYWFSGQRLLEAPLEDMLSDPDSTMPFCLCWANENWTRRWDAAEHEILIAQTYLPADDIGFARSLLPYLQDSRYIRVNGAPLLIVYRPQQLPDPKITVQRWREFFRTNGVGEIHLCAALTHGNQDFASLGFDSGVEFPPHNLSTKSANEQIKFHAPFRGKSVMFHEVAESYLGREYEHNPVFRTVFPSWDNTARTKERALIVQNGTPKNYAHWLALTIDKTLKDPCNQEHLVFINAWNEWAEGCHLEPDRKYGLQFLEATQKALCGVSTAETFPDREIQPVARKKRLSFSAELLDLCRRHGYYWHQNALEFLEARPQLKRVLKAALLRR